MSFILFLFAVVFIWFFYSLYKDVMPKKKIPTYDKILTSNLPPIPNAKPMYNDSQGWNMKAPLFVRVQPFKNNTLYTGHCKSFNVIDFETANSYPDSVCSVGIVKVENNEITEKIKYFIKPPYKSITNSHVHGITWEHLYDAPDFSLVWNEIKPYIEGQIIATYNLNFDAGCLESLFKCYGIKKVSYAAFDILETARENWIGVNDYKLVTIANHLGIIYHPHNSLDDAIAAAKVQIEANKKKCKVSIKCQNMNAWQIRELEFMLQSDFEAFEIAKNLADKIIEKGSNDFSPVYPYLDKITQYGIENKYIAKAHRLYGEIFESQNDFLKALEHYEKAFAYDTKVGVKLKIAKLKKKGSLYV